MQDTLRNWLIRACSGGANNLVKQDIGQLTALIRTRLGLMQYRPRPARRVPGQDRPRL
jgi:hypothetical protein